MPKLICQFDGKEFTAQRATAKYCSEKCKKAAQRGTKTPELPREIRAAINLGQAFAEHDRASVSPPIAIPSIVSSSKQELIAEMNARLAAKGLPLLSEEMEKVSFVHTGIQDIDELSMEYDPEGIGGFPRKHLTEIFGTKGSGKTSLMKLVIQNTTDLKVLYMDVENGMLNPPESAIVSKATVLEDIEGIVVDAVQGGKFDLIVIDSVAAMSSIKEREGDGEAMMAKAKAMAQFTRRVNASLRPMGPDGHASKAPGTAVVFINQLRDTGKSFGVKEYTPGGRSLEYMASLRLELRSAKADKIMKGTETIGQKVRVKIEKSRFDGGDVGTTVVFKLMFAQLQDQAHD